MAALRRRRRFRSAIRAADILARIAGHPDNGNAGNLAQGWRDEQFGPPPALEAAAEAMISKRLPAGAAQAVRPSRVDDVAATTRSLGRSSLPWEGTAGSAYR